MFYIGCFICGEKREGGFVNVVGETTLAVVVVFDLQVAVFIWERSGSVVECLNRDRRAASSSLTGVTALCLSKTHLSLLSTGLLVQPRKTHPC